MAFPTALFIITFILLCGNGSYGNKVRNERNEENPRELLEEAAINLGQPSMSKKIAKRANSGEGIISFVGNEAAGDNPTTKATSATTGGGGNETGAETVQQTVAQSTAAPEAIGTVLAVATPPVPAATIAVQDARVEGEAQAVTGAGSEAESTGNMPQMSYIMQLANQLLAIYFIFGI